MICITFYIVCIYNILITSAEYTEVKTTLGTVKGKLVNDVTTGIWYHSFEGIPYAEPPVGRLRFKPPIQKRAWSGVFDATSPGCICPQPENRYIRTAMDEDCLNFNVYTPCIRFNYLLPVIFNIHGGDFTLLSGNAEPVYGPQLLLQNDIVVVTMNYRLGVLGFLSLCTEEVSGNAGLKDIILVLKIVHENIAKFGGDPNKITLMGHGAGAAMAEYLMLSNQCNGLFQNVVLNSGSILNSKFIQLYPRINAELLGEELGFDSSNDNYFMKKLRHVSAFDLVKAQEAISRRDPQRGFRKLVMFKPTVEVECGSAVITKPPLQLIREGAISNVPVFIGFTDQEGLELFQILREEPELIDKLNKNFELLIPIDIQYPYGSVERRNLAERIREFYFDGGKICFGNVQNYINLISDSKYTYSIDLFIRQFKNARNASVYYYMFNADTELNWYKAFVNMTYPGAAHFDDVGYIFLTEVTKPKYQCLSPTTKHIQDTMILNLKHFMCYGAPAPNSNTNNWPETGNNGYHLRQDENSIVVFHRPIPERIQFWRTVYEEYFTSKYNTSTYFCENHSIRSIFDEGL